MIICHCIKRSPASTQAVVTQPHRTETNLLYITMFPALVHEHTGSITSQPLLSRNTLAHQIYRKRSIVHVISKVYNNCTPYHSGVFLTMGQYYKYENQTPGHTRSNLASTATLDVNTLALVYTHSGAKLRVNSQCQYQFVRIVHASHV